MVPLGGEECLFKTECLFLSWETAECGKKKSFNAYLKRNDIKNCKSKTRYSEHSHNNGRESTLAVLSLNQNREAYQNEGAYIL